MNKILLISLFLLLSHFSFSQNVAFTEDEFVWCGLDFSLVKLIGKEGFNNVGEIKDYYFKRWNYLLLEEYEKYNLKEAYNKDVQHTNLSIANQRNSVPRVNSLVQSIDHDITQEDLLKIIELYKNIDDNAKSGLVFIVETLSKSDNYAKINVVFFGIRTGEILWSRQIKGKPEGIGFRNFWMGAFDAVIHESSYYFRADAHKYKKQEKKKAKDK